MVSAKLLIGKPFTLSGSLLLWSLLSVIVSIAVGADWFLGNPITLGNSITLPLVLCLGLSAIAGHWAVPFLRALKTGQIIREEGPQSHQVKAGTPTMGGLFFIPVAVLVALLLTHFSVPVVIAGVLTLLYVGVGFLDDWRVIQRKSNKGISPRNKLILQVGGAVLLTLWLFTHQTPDITTVLFPFGLALPLGGLFWILAGFVPVAQSNATNLTDGLDGLASGIAALTFLGLSVLTAVSSPELMIFSASMAGACLGFLCHNRNPARVFMGDTGSLAIGGSMGAIALLSGQLFGLFILSGIFVAESLSVIAQVGYYKATKDENGVGKRLFRMAPLHHHFELSGWSELKVVAVFYTVTVGLVALALGLCL
ncbi:MAG: phospho-N-acetylmuramoyl-pentapeptide-transferase [Cyanobacteria bacterium P01_F01_bin.150]